METKENGVYKGKNSYRYENYHTGKDKIVRRKA